MFGTEEEETHSNQRMGFESSFLQQPPHRDEPNRSKAGMRRVSTGWGFYGGCLVATRATFAVPCYATLQCRLAGACLAAGGAYTQYGHRAPSGITVCQRTCWATVLRCDAVAPMANGRLV